MAIPNTGHPCPQKVQKKIFFPVAENGPELARAVARAKRVCAGCPVRIECLGWATEALPHGVAGGMTAEERREARSAQRPLIRKIAMTRRPPSRARHQLDARRSPVIEAGQSALAQGVPRDRVAVEFGVTRRTVDRWAADQRRAGVAAALGGGR